MCGIVGYIGPKEAYPIIVKGLKRLEYRGYDSAGLALYDGEKFISSKTKGKVSDLEAKAEQENTFKGCMGIGHTRWATHGVPNDVNSHPHFSNSAIDAMGQGKSQGKELSVYQYSQLISQVLQQYNPSAVISHSLGSFALLEALSTIVNPALKKVVIMGCLDNFKDIVDNYYQMMGYSSSFQKDFTAYLENIIGRDITQYAGHIFAEDLSLDTLIIHDKEDEIIPLASCKALHDILQQNKAKLIYTKNLDHSLQDPKVYQSIKDFIVVS